MSLIVFFTGAVSATIVAPAGNATASASAPTVGAPHNIVVPVRVATATRKAGLYPMDAQFPTDLLVPEAGSGTPTINMVAPATTVTASATAPTVRTTIMVTVPTVTVSRVAPVFALTVVSPLRLTTASRTAGVPYVAPLATPTARVTANQLRLASPTGQQEAGYINVTLRQLA